MYSLEPTSLQGVTFEQFCDQKFWRQLFVSFRGWGLGVDRFSSPPRSDSMQTLECLLFLDLVFICLSSGPMWLGCVRYFATETILPGYARVSMCMALFALSVCVCERACVSDCARVFVCVCVDARLSPVEEAQCVSVEVEGESRASFYKSGQITEAERPATPLQYPASSALCHLTHSLLTLHGSAYTVLGPVQ